MTGEPARSSRPTGSPPERGRRPHVWPLIVLNLSAVLLAQRFLNGALGEWGGDNVYFLLLAEALSRGQGYVDLYWPGQPAHFNYPPLYPLLLTPFVLAGSPLIVFKGFTAALGLAGLNVCYFVLLRWHDRTTALLVSLSTLCCGAFLDSGLSIMSESPYFLFSMLTVLLVQRSFDADRRSPGLWVASGATMGLSVLTRLIGVVFGPATIAFALLTPARHLGRWERARRLAVIGVVAAALAGPWFLRGAASEATRSRNYFREFTDNQTIQARIEAEAEKNRLAASRRPPAGDVVPLEKLAAPPQPARGSRVRELMVRPLDNLRNLGTRLSDTPLPESIVALGPQASLAVRIGFVALCALLAGLAFLGWIRGLLTRRSVHDFYVSFYLLLLLVWIGGGFRMVMPILVFLLAYVYEGAVFLARFSKRASDFGRLVLAVSIVANLAVTFQFPLIRDRLDGRYAPWWADLLTATCRLGTVARPGQKVIASPENVPYYLAGLQAGRLPERNTPEALLEVMLVSKADFLITSSVQLTRYGEKISVALRKYPVFFRRIIKEGDIEVYRILRDPGADASEPPEPAASAASGSARCAEVLR